MNLLDVSLSTRRLTIRPLHSGDLHSLISGLREYFVSDANKLMWPHPPKDVAQTKEFLEQARRALVTGQRYAAAIERKGIDFVGAIFLADAASVSPELGVWITAHQARRGYGLEAAEAVLAWARGALLIETVRFHVVRGNSAGLALAHKLRGELTLERREPDGTELIEFTLR
jgi:RimJ/RimL family protein N-acetyltransferase